MKVNVLGTEYEIFTNVEDDPSLEGADGYCDTSVKKIVIKKMKEDRHSVEDLDSYEKKVIRHELIHAFLYESGLDTCSWHCEEVVDWIALQSGKMNALFEEIGV